MRKPKTRFVEPQSTTTPNHFCSTHKQRTNQIRGLSVFKYATLALLTLLSALVAHLSQAIQSKASRMQEAFKVRKILFPNQFLVVGTLVPTSTDFLQLESGAIVREHNETAAE